METRDGSLEVAAEFGVSEAAEGSAMVERSCESVDMAGVGVLLERQVSSD